MENNNTTTKINGCNIFDRFKNIKHSTERPKAIQSISENKNEKTNKELMEKGGALLSEIGITEAEPKHEVSLSAFKMSAYEVTFEQYDAFCVATKREKPGDKGWGRGKHPVINVSWDDATAFAKWMVCRLPTEAEWEYACRAGSTTPFNTGKDLTTSQANYRSNKTTAVGSFAANAWGLYDMHGNVWEWCSDLYADYPSSPQTNPAGASKGSQRIYRGGCWESSRHSCLTAYRNHMNSGYCCGSIGFRLVSLK